MSCADTLLLLLKKKLKHKKNTTYPSFPPHTPPRTCRDPQKLMSSGAGASAGRGRGNSRACKFWAQGSCTKGATSCPHQKSARNVVYVVVSNLSVTRPGPACTFRHDDAEGGANTRASRACKFWPLGTCTKGESAGAECEGGAIPARFSQSQTDTTESSESQDGFRV